MLWEERISGDNYDVDGVALEQCKGDKDYNSQFNDLRTDLSPDMSCNNNLLGFVDNCGESDLLGCSAIDQQSLLEINSRSRAFINESHESIGHD